MNKFFINVFALLISTFIVGIGVFLFKNEILNYYDKSLESLKKTNELQSDLESGKIVVFGSSELLNSKQKFIPQNYFNNDLKLPLRVQGNEGHQEFVILSQLAALENEKVKENAKVVILLSPSWFTGNSDNGTKIPKFLEYMYPGMMNKLYFQSSVDDKFKILINEYVRKNFNFIKEPGYIYTHTFEEFKENYFDNQIKKFIINIYENRNRISQTVSYQKPKFDYESLKIEAKNVELPSNNNSFGINNDNYTKFIEPTINKEYFPFTIILPKIEENQEYKDFLLLLELLQNYKIKPLFIMQDLNPYIFAKNREEMNILVSLIKSKVEEKGFEYFDMWSYKKEDYEFGVLTDSVHLGELGWVKVNQKIIEHFMQ